MDFDKKLRKINNKVASSKTKHVEVKKKVTDLSKTFFQMSIKR